MHLSGELARSLLEAAPDATVIVDAEGKIVFANARIKEAFGYEPSELYESLVEVLLPPRFRNVHFVHREAFSAAPKPQPMGTGLGLYGLHKDGHEFPVEVSLSPVRTDAGQLLVVAAIRDATLHKDTEHQLLQANREKSRFLAAASHDLRQPLQTLNLLNRVARREVVGNPRLEMIVDKQQRALDSMSDLLASVLDISKLDSGAVVPELVDCRIDDVFERLVSDFEPQANEKGLELVFERCGEGVRTDVALLRRLLGNLVSNAIRYTHRGTVGLRAIACGGTLEIEVTDTGVGIPPDQIEPVFEEFHQVDRGSHRPEGLGLGLSIVRRIANLLALEVGVRSVPNQGTTRDQRLPSAGWRNGTDGRRGRAHESEAGNPRRVLDRQYHRSRYRHRLRRARPAADEAAARRRIARNDPDGARSRPPPQPLNRRSAEAAATRKLSHNLGNPGHTH